MVRAEERSSVLVRASPLVLMLTLLVSFVGSALGSACNASDMSVCRASSGRPCLSSAKPSMICTTSTGKACIGRAPTCAQIRAVDAQWGVDNGELCDSPKGYWLTPEPGSAFPIAITRSIPHGDDSTATNNGPATNSHWHPFCMTIDGVERIKTFDSGAAAGTNTTMIWAGVREKAGCADFPGALPSGTFTAPAALPPAAAPYTGRLERIDLQSAPTCADISILDVIGADSGDLCGTRFWFTPEEGNALPIAVTTSKAHKSKKVASCVCTLL